MLTLLLTSRLRSASIQQNTIHGGSMRSSWDCWVFRLGPAVIEQMTHLALHEEIHPATSSGYVLSY